MTITTGPNLGLMDGAADGETHASDMRKFLRGVDGLVQTRALTLGTNAPPGSPANGDVHVIGAAPTGAWAGQANKIARYRTIDTTGWDFYAPKEGWRVAVVGVGDYRYSGTAWQTVQARPASTLLSGLQMVWVSGTSLTVTSGDVYIPGLGYVIETVDIAKAGLSLTASTWYHVYVFSNAGAADIEIVTTAPAAPYRGTARTKTGDTSRRYIGSVRTDGAGAIYRFLQTSNIVKYLLATDVAPFRALSGGQASVPTAVSLSAIVPITSRLASMMVRNLDTSLPLTVGTPDATNIVGIRFGVTDSGNYPTDANQAVSYNYSSAPTGVANMDVMGYTYER